LWPFGQWPGGPLGAASLFLRQSSQTGSAYTGLICLVLPPYHKIKHIQTCLKIEIPNTDPGCPVCLGGTGLKPPPVLTLRGAKWFPDSHLLWTWDQESGLKTIDPSRQLQQNILFTDAELKAPALPDVFDALVWSADKTKFLLFTNTKRVWRARTRGDYWYYDLAAKKGHQLGKGLPDASLMFAKISPDGTRAAYVSKHNIYLEDLSSGKITPLTTDGTDKIINGTFDWAYEEELACRDGFRWSPDSKHIAFWRIDATGIRFFDMIDNTDSLYSFVVPVEYPKTGQNPFCSTYRRHRRG
jgi:dipeptidyl-peptidase-4